MNVSAVSSVEREELLLRLTSFAGGADLDAPRPDLAQRSFREGEFLSESQIGARFGK